MSVLSEVTTSACLPAAYRATTASTTSEVLCHLRRAIVPRSGRRRLTRLVTDKDTAENLHYAMGRREGPAVCQCPHRSLQITAETGDGPSARFYTAPCCFNSTGRGS
jgi:hypothetical protein